MAEMIPRFFGPGPASERYVYRALELNLPASWTVWWSLSYSLLAGEEAPAGDLPAEGEIDFLCAHPEHGLIVLEVKGGDVSFTNEGWFQDHRRLRTPPPEQATRNRHALLHILCRRLKVAPLPLPIVHALWLPFTQPAPEEPLPLAGITLYAADLVQPEAAFLRLLATAPKPQAGPPFYARLRALLTPALAAPMPWRQRRVLADARLARLTHEQALAFDAFSQFPALRVRGCAGSGKTLLALRRATQLAQAGKRVLLLCFNLLLAQHLQSLTAAFPTIRATAIYDFLLALLQRTPNPDDPEFWHTLAQAALPAARALAQSAPYDAIIIDEGQDFSPPLWRIISTLAETAQTFLIFYDPAQNIFQRDLSAIPTFPWPEATLSINCRNTRAVFQILRPYAPDNARLFPDVPPGDPPETYTANTRQGLRERLRTILQSLTQIKQIPIQDILLIGAHARPKMDLEPILAQFPGLRYFTYRKYKGLEAPILILLDLSDNDPLWNPTARYAAISRAIHKVILLELRADPTP